MQKNKNFIFHLGLPKTGTTFLQDNVFKNIINGKFINKPRGSLDELLTELCYSQEKNILVSEENILGRSSKLAINGYNLLKNYELSLNALSRLNPSAKIIVFFREPSAAMVSNYREYIYAGGTTTFEEWMQIDGLVETFNYLKIIQIIDYYFNNTMYFDYNDLKQNLQSTIKMMSKFTNLNFEIPRTIVNARSNVGIKNTNLELMRIVNRLRKTHYNKRFVSTKLIRKKFFKCFPLNVLNSIGTDNIDGYRVEYLKNEYSELWKNTQHTIKNSQNKTFQI